MADISKCFGKNCPKKKTCYRYTAEANPYRQSYAAFDNNSETCEHYWQVEEKPKKKKTKEVICVLFMKGGYHDKQRF
jgi:hypothetical protein